MTVQHLSSQQIFIGKTEIPSICPNYDVIQNGDPESCPSLFSALGDGALSL
jgi:hypothetical protein